MPDGVNPSMLASQVPGGDTVVDLVASQAGRKELCTGSPPVLPRRNGRNDLVRMGRGDSSVPLTGVIPVKDTTVAHATTVAPGGARLNARS